MQCFYARRVKLLMKNNWAFVPICILACLNFCESFFACQVIRVNMNASVRSSRDGYRYCYIHREEFCKICESRNRWDNLANGMFHLMIFELEP